MSQGIFCMRKDKKKINKKICRGIEVVMYPNETFLQSDGGMPHQNRALKKSQSIYKKSLVFIRLSYFLFYFVSKLEIH